MKYVDKIIFRDKETYNKLYQGSELLFEVKPTNEYDVLYVSGRYEFKIPKGDGTYYIIDTKNDCEADVITDEYKYSLNETIISSTSVADEYEWELFFNGSKLYFDMGKNFDRRLSLEFGELKKDTKYLVKGGNGNYKKFFGNTRSVSVNGRMASSTVISTYNNTSDIINIGSNTTGVYISNINIYENTGLVYHIVPIMYNGNVAFYDKVNKQFMEIVSTPPSEYAKTRTTGEKVII